MKSTFFYNDQLDQASLRQGDVVRRTPEVENILHSVHPYYFHREDYKYFIVLTQSCDLVVRKTGQCDSRYVTIAAVRPVALAVRREVSRYQYSALERKLGICNRRGQHKLRDFAESLLNNNRLNYFFLPANPDMGLGTDFCAFLQLTVALKADPHYETLLKAKILQLTDSFQHKLGHLVGTSYSRVATEDWAPDNMTLEDFRKWATALLTGIENWVLWLDDRVHKQVLEEMESLPEDEQSLTKAEEIVGRIRTAKEEKRELALSEIAQTMTELGVPDEMVKKTCVRLQSSPVFAAVIR